jgi:tetratricopeptide (TPR) repeat protein
MADLVENPKFCAQCGAPGCHFKCPCKQVNYCGRNCQHLDWHKHAGNCRSRLKGAVKKAILQHGRYDVQVAEAWRDAGCAHLMEGRFPHAERCFLEARQIFSLVFGERNPDTSHTCRMLGQVYDAMGRYDESIEVLGQSLDIEGYYHDEGSMSEGVASTLCLMARPLASQGKHGEALGGLEEAFEILHRIHGDGVDHETAAEVASQMGLSHRALGQLDRALEVQQEALRICRIDNADDDSQQVAMLLVRIGDVFADQDKLVEAMTNHEEALGMLRRLHGERHPSVASALSSIGNVLLKRGEYEEALKLHKKALKIKRRVHGRDHRNVADIVSIIGDNLSLQKKYEEALQSYKEALDIYTRALGTDNVKNAEMHYKVAKTRHVSGHAGGLVFGQTFVEGSLESARESARIYDKLGVSNQDAANLLKQLEGRN